MKLEKEIVKRFDQISELISKTLDENLEKLKLASEKIAQCIQEGGKIFFFGNGGSASQAQHFSAEFVNRMILERRPLPAIALTTDTSILTSISNDRSFEQVFVLQLKALAKPGDIAVGLSTSGSSKNVILALQEAKKLGLWRLGFAGKPGAPIGEVADLCLWVNSDSVPRIQEVHLLFGHILCEMVERILFGEK